MRILILVSSLFTFSAFANDCYDKLLNGKDSTSIRVLADFDEQTKSEDNARVLVARALEKRGCKAGEIVIKSVTCSRIVPTEAFTEVCVLKADEGYFFAMKDFVDGANVVFNRWD